MALLMLLVSIAMTVVNGERPNIKPKEEIAARHHNLVTHAKQLYDTLDDSFEIQKEMEFFSDQALKLYRDVFVEYFTRDQSFEETPPDTEFYKNHKLPETSQVYILAAGTFATNEATATSDFDFIIIVIDEKDKDHPGQASLRAKNGLKPAVESYGKVLLKKDDVYKETWRVRKPDRSAATTGMNVDIASSWVMVFESLDHFEHYVRSWSDNIAKFADVYTPMIQSAWVYGHNVNQQHAYHDLMTYFWRALPMAIRIRLFDDTVLTFYLRDWKKSVKNKDHFSFKHTILRPLTLPTVYFYELAYQQHIHSIEEDKHRAKSTLDRWNMLAKYGYLSKDEVDAIKNTFLWAHKEQLKANLVKSFEKQGDDTVYIYHGAIHEVTGETATPINANLEKVKRFMEHMISQFKKLEENKNWEKKYEEIKDVLILPK